MDKKLTFKEILEIDGIVARLYKEDKNLVNSKFGYAYKRYYAKNYTPALEEFQNGMETIRINNALEDKDTKALITDEKNPRGYKYSKEGLKKCIEEENKYKETYFEKEIEIVPFLSPLIPENLSEEDRELLTGVVI